MQINVSPVFSESLREINRLLIAWECHELTAEETTLKIINILPDDVGLAVSPVMPYDRFHPRNSYLQLLRKLQLENGDLKRENETLREKNRQLEETVKLTTKLVGRWK
mgnify:CR=1 FL=1